MRAPSASSATARSAAPEPRPLEQPRRPEREREREADHEERPRLDLGAGDPDEAGAADAVERQRVGEDVARALEGRADHRPDREGDRHRPGDPADRRPAREVRLHQPDVGGRPRRRRRQRARRASASRKRGSCAPACVTGRRPRQHEQRREHAEPDEVAEREVHDPGQPVDERVPGREEPVDPAGREPADQHLQRDRHSVRTVAHPPARRRHSLRASDRRRASLRISSARISRWSFR